MQQPYLMITNDSDFRESIQDIFEFQIEGAGTTYSSEGGVVKSHMILLALSQQIETFDAVLDDSDLAAR